MMGPPPFGTVLSGSAGAGASDSLTVMSLGTLDQRDGYVHVLVLATTGRMRVGEVYTFHPVWVAVALIVENGPEPRTTA